MIFYSSSLTGTPEEGGTGENGPNLENDTEERNAQGKKGLIREVPSRKARGGGYEEERQRRFRRV